jgi:hypothetical protein
MRCKEQIKYNNGDWIKFAATEKADLFWNDD